MTKLFSDIVFRGYENRFVVVVIYHAEPGVFDAADVAAFGVVNRDVFGVRRLLKSMRRFPQQMTKPSLE